MKTRNPVVNLELKNKVEPDFWTLRAIVTLCTYVLIDLYVIKKIRVELYPHFIASVDYNVNTRYYTNKSDTKGGN